MSAVQCDVSHVESEWPDDTQPESNTNAYSKCGLMPDMPNSTAYQLLSRCSVSSEQ